MLADMSTTATKQKGDALWGTGNFTHSNVLKLVLVKLDVALSTLDAPLGPAVIDVLLPASDWVSLGGALEAGGAELLASGCDDDELSGGGAEELDAGGASVVDEAGGAAVELADEAGSEAATEEEPEEGLGGSAELEEAVGGGGEEAGGSVVLGGEVDEGGDADVLAGASDVDGTGDEAGTDDMAVVERRRTGEREIKGGERTTSKGR